MANNVDPIGAVLMFGDDILKKISQIDKSLTSMQKNSDKASQNFIKAIQSSYGSVDALQNRLKTAENAVYELAGASGFDSMKKRVSDVNNEITKLINELNAVRAVSSSIGGTPTNLMRIASGLGTSAQRLNEPINQEEVKYEQIRNAAWREYADNVGRTSIELERLNSMYRNGTSEIQRQAKEEQRLAEEQRRYDALVEEGLRALQQYRQTYAGAMSFSANDGTSSLSRRRQAIQNLRAAIENLSTSDENYRQKLAALKIELQAQEAGIRRAEQGARRLRTEHRKLIDVSGQLRGMLAMTFSVYQVANFLKSVVKVRGEFEMQQVALRAIIQDLDEADKLWGKITALAVKSPFRVKELVTYTKQLAAYRIETDQLFDVTKRLADVSSGLGVDMQRLILAYGQVKAANYLRGQELRQFSEAGVNILGELAQYFTELEGRTISYGDVFERVSKRMVSFEDVAEVFRRITNEGGIFYNMQEKQAETLQGQISNLKDSFDLMFNAIGESVQGDIKKAVKMIKNLADNWEESSVIIKESIVVFGLFRLASSTTAKAMDVYTNAIVRNRLAQRYQQEATYGMIRSMTIAEGRAKGLSVAQILLVKGATRLSAAFNMIAASMSTILPVAVITGILVLINHLTKSHREAKRFNNELNDIFNKDIANANQTAKGFEDLVRKLKDVNQGSDEHRKIIDAINNRYGEYLGYLIDEKTTYDEMANSIQRVNDGLMRKAMANSLEKGVEKVYTDAYNKIGKIQDKFINKKGNPIFSAFLGEDFTNTQISKNDVAGITSRIEQAIKANGGIGQDGILKAIAGWFGYDDTSKVRGLSVYVLQYFQDIADELTRVSEAESRMQDVLEARYGSSAALTRQTYEQLKQIEKEYESAQKQINDNTKLSNIEKSVQLEALRLEYAEKRLRLQRKDINGTTNWSDSDEKWVQEQLRKMQKNLGITLEDVNRKIREAVANGEMSKSVGDWIYITEASAAGGMSEVTKEVISQYKLLKESLEKYQQLEENGTAYDEAAKKSDEERIEALKKKAYWLGVTDEELNGKNKGGGSKKDPELERLKNILDALKDANSEYEKLRQNSTAAKSNAEVTGSFNNRFKELGILSMTNGKTFDDAAVTGLVASFREQLLSKLSAASRSEGELAIQEFLTGFTSDETVDRNKAMLERLKGNIEEMIQNLSLYKEMQKEGVTADVFTGLFGKAPETYHGISERVAMSRDAFYELGKAGEEAYAEMLSKVNKLENDHYREQLKEYMQYLRTAMNERVKIEYEGLTKMKEVDANGLLNDTQKDTIRKRIQEDMNKRLNEQTWDEFKGTDMYVNLFQDMTAQSSFALKAMRDKMVELQGSLTDLDATNMRNLVGQIDKLNEELFDRKPVEEFRRMRDEIRKMEELTGAGNEGALDSMLFGKTGDSNALANEINGIQTLISLMEDGKTMTEEEAASIGLSQKYLSMRRGLLMSILGIKKEEKEQTDAEIEDLERQKQLYNLMRSSLGRFAKSWQDMTGKIGEAVTASLEMADAMGWMEDNNTNNAFKDLGESLISLIGTIPTYIMMMKAAGVASNSALGVIGWIATGIQMVVTLISKIAKIHDARIDDEIEDIEKRVQRLKDAYDEASESFDRAWDLSSLNTYNNAMKGLINQQIAARQMQIAAEQRSKKKDKDKIDEWKKEIKDLNKQLEEQQQEFLTETGGIGVDAYRSTAEAFAEAWMSAFQETGDGMDGLEEHFDSMMDDLVKKQLTLRIVRNRLEELFNYIDNEALVDGKLENDEAAQIRDIFNRSKGALSEELESLYSQLGFGTDAEGSLSGLSESLKGMTEQTAEQLAAYLNSIRTFTSQQTTAIMEAAKSILSPDASTNPIISELRQQTAVIRDIRDALHATIGDGITRGKGIRIFMQ